MRNRGLIPIRIGLLVCFCIIQSVLGAGSVTDRDGKIAAKPLFRDPIYDGAADPVLCWNREKQKWFMFYTNRRANVPGTVGVSWVHGTPIGIAESSDGGATWKYRTTARIDYKKGKDTYWAPEVIGRRRILRLRATRTSTLPVWIVLGRSRVGR